MHYLFQSKEVIKKVKLIRSEKHIGFLEKNIGFLEKNIGFLEKANFTSKVLPIFARGGLKNNINNITNIIKGGVLRPPTLFVKLIQKIPFRR